LVLRRHQQIVCLSPKEQRTGRDIYPAEGDVSRLDHLYPHEHPPAYVDVKIPRSDLRRITKIYLNEYVDEAKQLKKGKWS
jgi:hypothetical protein